MRVHFYRRADGKIAWSVIAGNGQVVSTDGGQGYENREDAVTMAQTIYKNSIIQQATFAL